MGHKERILEHLRRSPGLDDDEIARVLGISPRQTVNKICRALVESGGLRRHRREDGRIGNFPEPNVAKPEAQGHPRQAPQPNVNVPTDWFWEGHVVAMLVVFLVGDGWTIIRCADTASREQGPDIHAERSGETLFVEVKGYPSKHYRDARRAGEKKRTIPSLQAQHWFSHAVLKGMRLQNEFPEATVALGLPEFPRYQGLAREIGDSLATLGLTILFVNEAGAVSWIRDEEE